MATASAIKLWRAIKAYSFIGVTILCYGRVSFACTRCIQVVTITTIRHSVNWDSPRIICRIDIKITSFLSVIHHRG